MSIHHNKYCGDVAPTQFTFFNHLVYRCGERFVFQFSRQSAFLFVLQGIAELLCNCGKTNSVETGKMYSFSHDFYFEGEAKSDSVFIVFTFQHPIEECEDIHLVYNKFNHPDKRPKRENHLYSLTILPPIFHFLTNLIYYEKEAILNHTLLQLKQREWFILMHTLYTEEENASFFASLIWPEEEFKIMVKERAKNISSVTALAEACHMTTKTFTRHFKKNFNTTPKKWLLTQNR